MNSRFRIFKKAGPIPENPMHKSWEYSMAIALKEAHKAFLSGEIPVGAIIIDPYGNLIAKAFNQVETQNDPTAHAEILALRFAAKKMRNHILQDCILLTTLEPCLMCAAAIINARISGLVYGAADIESGVISSNADLFDTTCNDKKIWHMGGVLSEQSAYMLKTFFENKRIKKKG